METMYYIFIIIVGVIAPSFMKKRTDESLHISQLEGYEYEHYLAWIKNNRDKAYSLNKNNQPVKKPLVMTNRAKRLFNTNYVINIIFFIITAILFVSLLRDYIAILLMIIVLGILYYLQPLTMALATLVMEPIEKKINMGFYVSAQKKIKTREDLKVVGITGSFGKTSTKFIVGAILEEKFNVLNTPESYIQGHQQ